ncbi:transporter substrate-binding domain-containing protein [Kutzneria buriramensis]|uniref:Polar amino acid transport system substrate-binding protein n=1 Tax=Kutzneria buriramensis TaxID=1045776 RepID=A0A3E0GV12_9PSEU|nr:transporter substrate-binding domain-containing protein [Kutzneria buriramensis]REH29577.1 polar amino acid transport system substrate-binding protein [Kutzneria buriramensis]
MARSGVVGLSLAALAVVLTACGTGNAADPAAPTSTSVAFPTQDVVSAVQTDAAVRAELPPSTKSLTLGTTLAPGTASLPHSGQVDGDKYVGVDVDLRDAVAKVLGITWTVQNGTFETIIPGVQNGKYDVGQDNFGVTAAREKVVDFATYLTDGQSFLGPADHGPSSVNALTDLCGLTVATSPGSTFQQILTSGADKCAAAGKKPYTVQLFSDTAPIWLGLANGKVDVYFGPTLSLKYDEKHVPNTKFLGQFSSTPVGFVTGKGSPVAKAVSDAVNKLIKTGDYAKILAKWGVDSSGIPQSAVNPAPTL